MPNPGIDRAARAPIPQLPYRFTRRDAAAAGFYVLFLLLFSFVPGLGIPLLAWIPDPLLAGYVVNLMFYLLAGILAAWASWRYVVRETRILATRPWLTAAIVPAAVLATLILAAIVSVLAGPPPTSVNQEAVQGLVLSLPPLLVIPLLVLLGPFVEEYVFRHLLIGKLSRILNIWACCALSVVLFAGIHVFGTGDASLAVMVPYLAIGTVLVAVYVWAGNNFVLTYLIHASRNLLAVIVTYSVPPELLQ